ncbi:uncharacterized protein [Phyllobates terribilis]|uniref:uncharacterized protein n=1 Tax=Phyllobates terribilis TaxID=111132 RepID=UPI003CCABBF3
MIGGLWKLGEIKGRMPTNLLHNPHNLLPSLDQMFLTQGGTCKARGNQEESETCYIQAEQNDKKAVHVNQLYVSGSLRTKDKADLDPREASRSPARENTAPTSVDVAKHAISPFGEEDKKLYVGQGLLPEVTREIETLVEASRDIFVWTQKDFKGIPPEVMTHYLAIDPQLFNWKVLEVIGLRTCRCLKKDKYEASHHLLVASIITTQINVLLTTTTTDGATTMLNASTTTKPGCHRQCGNLKVPYPFGISAECSQGYWYEIVCNTTYDPPKPFLGRGNLEIVEISETQMKIKNGVAKQCFSSLGNLTDQLTVSIDLFSSPYTFSDTLKLVVVGCDDLAIITGTKGRNFASGCISLCSRKEDLLSGTCSGLGCSQIPIPDRLKQFRIGLQSLNNHTNVSSFDSCGYAFLAEDENVGTETTCIQAQHMQSSYACKQNSKCIDVDLGSKGYRCSCLSGYEGNPYLTPGCTDVNECGGPSNPCFDPNRCSNIPGGFDCSCPKGHHGDALKNGTGCVSSNSESSLKITLVPRCTTIALLLALLCINWIYMTIKNRKVRKMREKFFQQNGGFLMKQHLASHQGGNTSSNIFTADELKSATNNYSQDRILGKGGYGTVYKGVLSDKREVAIKKSMVSDKTQTEQFVNEVVILTQINHRNVVKLLGCCLETEVPLLVYELVSNGTLFEHIHKKARTSWLSWANCVRIASEAADALSYLHSAASIPIIHRDIKSSNILIDESFTAKISDFGASRLIPLDQDQVLTMVQGTLGYLDPEYFQTSQLTEKSDVYSFGVLLAELITRKKPLCKERKSSEKNLGSYFLLAMKEDRLWEVIHDDLMKEASSKQLIFMAKLIKDCLEMKGEDRPTMKEVAIELDCLKKRMNHPWDRRSQEEGTSLVSHSEEDLYLLNLDSHMNSIPDSGPNSTLIGCSNRVKLTHHGHAINLSGTESGHGTRPNIQPHRVLEYRLLEDRVPSLVEIVDMMLDDALDYCSSSTSGELRCWFLRSFLLALFSPSTFRQYSDPPLPTSVVLPLLALLHRRLFLLLHIWLIAPVSSLHLFPFSSSHVSS